MLNSFFDTERTMEDKTLYDLLKKTAKSNPGRYIAILDDGAILVSETKEKLFEKARSSGVKIKGIGHGINKKYKHFVY